MKKKIFLILIIFFVLYLILFAYTSNYHKNNDVPIIDIRLNNDITLNTIHTNDKDIKYKNNKMTIDKTKYNNVTVKGRGNYTWTLTKKPYQISFDDKTSILDFKKSKKYVLLANALDPSLLKNDFTFNVAKKMGIKYTNTGTYIDLYVDKKYLGNYYLVPQVNINSSSVDIKDDNAILMELDNKYYEEETYFKTKYFKDYITIKDQKNEDNKDGYIAFQKKYNQMEKNIHNNNYKWLKDNIDIESFVKYYIVIDFAMNHDSYQSSFYMYMNGLDDKIHAGPVWDFDIGYDGAVAAVPHLKSNASIMYERLYSMKEFKKEVSTYWRTNACKIYKEEIDNLDNKIESLSKTGEANSMFWNNNHYSKYTDRFNDWVIKRYDYFNNRYGCDNS